MREIFTNSDGKLSHKRVFSGVALLCLIIALIADIWGKPIQDTLLLIFASLVLGQSGFATFEKKFKTE